MDNRFLQDGFDKKMLHFIEECAEASAVMNDAIQAICKIQRWGLDSVNPLLPLIEQETNRAALIRTMAKIVPELEDVERAIARLQQDIHTAEYDAG